MTHSHRRFALACLLAASAAPTAAAAPQQPPDCLSGTFDIYFDEYEAELPRASREVLNTAQKRLKGCVIEQVIIVGMAGAKGGEQANMDLSIKRVGAIADALAEGGWPRDKFELRAAGEAGATTPTGAPSRCAAWPASR